MRALFVELLGGFGDLLLALPSVHALALSGWEVDVLTFAPGDELLRHDPHVRRVLATSDHSSGAPRRAVQAALAEGYDLFVTTTRYDGIGDLPGAARAVTDLWQRPPGDELVDRRFLRLLVEAGVVDAALVDQPLHVHTTGSLELGLDAPVVLVNGAGMPVKRWPWWEELAGRLPGAVLSTEPLTGAALLPRGDLQQLAASLAGVAASGGVVVGGDTGPVRLAAAVGAPVVGLFGPTAASRYGYGAPHADLQGLPSCAVRRPTAITEQECWWEARCPLSVTGPACLEDLPVEVVLAEVLARRRRVDPRA